MAVNYASVIVAGGDPLLRSLLEYKLIQRGIPHRYAGLRTGY